MQNMNRKASRKRIVGSLSGSALLALAAGLTTLPAAPVLAAQCQGTPAAGIDWQNCNKKNVMIPSSDLQGEAKLHQQPREPRHPQGPQEGVESVRQGGSQSRDQACSHSPAQGSVHAQDPHGARGGGDGQPEKKPSPAQAFEVGTVITREWQGRRHEVLVTAQGFEHQGEVHASLSEVARKITGVRWNGPRFFGLRKP